MEEIKPTYEELQQKLTQAEKIIAGLQNSRYMSLRCTENKSAAEHSTLFPPELEFLEAYIESEVNFRNSMDACPLGIRVITSEGGLFYANQAILDITGYSTVEELNAVPRQQLYTPESYAAHLERKEKRQRDEYIPSEYEVRIRRRDGDVRTLQVFRREITWGGKRQFMVMYQDITERLKLEATIRYHAKLIQSITDAIYSIDVEFKLLTWNKGAEEMFGWREEEVIGRNVIELIKPAHFHMSHQRLIEELRRNGYWKGDDLFQRKNGERFPVLISVSLLRDEKGNETGAVTVLRDITELKRAESELIIQRNFNQSMFRTAQVIMLVLEPDGRIFTFNPYMEEISGYKLEEVKGKSWFDVFLPERDRDEIKAYFLKTIQYIDTKGKINSIVTKDGREREIEWYNKTLKDPDGKVVGVLAVGQDVTEHHQAEMAIHQSEERFRRIFQAGPLGIILSNLDYTFTMANPRFCEMFGYSEKELLNMTFKDFSFPEDISESLALVERLIRGELPYYNTERRYRKKSGEIFWGSLTVTLIHDNEGKPQGFLAMIRDITKRKQDEKHINHLNLTLRSIRNVNQLITREKNRDRLIKGICENLVVVGSFENSWIVLLDDNRHPVTWAQSNYRNFSSVKLFKEGQLPYCAQKALKQKRVVVIENPYEQCPGCPALGAEREIGSMAVRLEIEGVIYGVLCASIPRELLSGDDEKSLFNEVADDIAFALRDIYLRSTHELLQQEQFRAAKLESIGTLAGGIAHDFNNLLTGIMGNIGLAKTFLPPSGNVYEILDEAEKAAVRSRDLTQQLLTFARGGKPIKKVADVGNIIRDAATFALRGSKTRLELYLPDDLWLIEADEGQISQVIHNLVINADEAMPHGGTLFITGKNLRVTREENLPLSDENYVCIEVHDTGIGIAPEFLQKIFEPYFTTKNEGSGLGLTSAYSIIKSHGGSLMVDSTLNKGSTFRIYLPASRKTVKGEKKVAAKESIQAGGKVLIMDDDEIIRKMLKNMLNLAGFEVEATADGNEALIKYKEAMDANDRFNAVIMDLTVPGGMGGKDAIKELLEIDPDAAVIVSSGYATDPIMSEYKKYGFSAVIAKPYSIKQLQETITGLIGKK